MNRARADVILKQPCRCSHSQGWHRGILPSNVRTEYLMAVPPGECRHPNCECGEFRLDAPAPKEIQG